MSSQRSHLPFIAGAIVKCLVKSLVPYARNARTHSEEQVQQLCASIREFGFTNPVLIDGRDGGIIAGHGRVLAAQQLGLTEVPCIDLQHLSAEQRRAYVLADNKIALNAGWDEGLLGAELAGLVDLEFAIGLTGFSEEEFRALAVQPTNELAEMPGLPDGDKAPFQQMTFTLHDGQAADVSDALTAAKALGPFVDSPNENSNGNALARICESFLGAHGNR